MKSNLPALIVIIVASFFMGKCTTKGNIDIKYTIESRSDENRSNIAGLNASA
jgi:hypothetical protein